MAKAGPASDRLRAVVPEPRRATAADVPALVGSLARAFHDDPLMRWVQPDDHRRGPTLRTFFSIQLRRVFVPAGHA